MSGKVSEFGSLADRTRSTQPAASGPVRHAWLDDHIPVLVADWRRGDHGSWEGLVIGAGEFGPAMTWVTAARLQAATVGPSQQPHNPPPAENHGS